jgi:lysophospholipase L1-like esterase
LLYITAALVYLQVILAIPNVTFILRELLIVPDSIFRACAYCAICFTVLATPCLAQTNSDTTADPAADESPLLPLPAPLIGDLNGDGIVQTDAFGDSITRGVGDFAAPGEVVESASRPTGEAGYPLRLELLLGIPVSNLGVPGERLTTRGLVRFAQNQPSRRPDVVLISGGTNDAIDQLAQTDYQRSVQTMINIARATGTLPVLVGIPETCCEASGILENIRAFNNTLATLAFVNEIALADVQHAYRNTCRGSSKCFLLNIPEGTHPNEAGYDVSAEVVIATLLNIDIFAPDGPSLLEQALALEPGSVKTIPDPTPVSTTPTS